MSYVIITEDDEILENNLTLFQAEYKLLYYVNHGEDAYIQEEPNNA